MNLLKHTAIIGIVSSTICLTPSASQALTVEEIPNPQTTTSSWVTDMADILSDSTETELNQLISNLEQTNSVEIAIVTVPETAPADSPKTFTTQLFNHWGIGKAESNNGILFLVSTGDNRVEIETGYGIEPILSDAQISKIIDTKVTPQYKHGNFDSGTLDGTRALVSSLDTSLTRESIPAPQNNAKIMIILTGISIASIGVFIELRNKCYKVFINPKQAITYIDSKDSRDVYCTKCKQPMKKVSNRNVTLTDAQKVAYNFGSVSFRGYKCSICSNGLQPYSVLGYISRSSRYKKCPECHNYTFVRTRETIKEPTHTSKGKKIVKDTCYCCDHIQENTEIIPTLRRACSGTRNSSHKDNYTDSSSGGGFSDSSSGGSSDSSSGGSSDSSSGGFGGGSSDGGGAGGDF